MRRLVALCLALTLLGGFVGCTKKAEVEVIEETTTTTPDGETIETTTETTTVEQSGENPPPADAPAP